jgi:hypothetical protein
MAAKTWTSTASSGASEILFHNDTVSLCLLVNRRHRTLRIIDFRAGLTVAKRNFVIAAAKRERVEKVFTLVERDEVATWTRLGFTREGSIPSFFRRSDAWILGAVVSEVRLLPSHQSTDSAAPDEEDTGSPVTTLAERTIQRARRLLKTAPITSLPRVRIAEVRSADARRGMAAALRSGRALTGFEPFGRDVLRATQVLTASGGFSLYASWESQACFGNSFFEILSGPRTESERILTTAAVQVLEAHLRSRELVSAFTLAPADDVSLAAVFLGAGFRPSGVLARQLNVRGDRKDAIVWSKKLAGSPEGAPAS